MANPVDIHDPEVRARILSAGWNIGKFSADAGPSAVYLIEVCHGLAKAAGWWLKHRSADTLLMLGVSELAEAMEGARKNLRDDKLPHRAMLEVELADFIIRLADMAGGLQSEDMEGHIILASKHHLGMAAFDDGDVAGNLFRLVQYVANTVDADHFHPSLEQRIARGIVGAFALGEHLSLDVPGAVQEKLAFNHTRPDHKLENRALEGGKSF